MALVCEWLTVFTKIMPISEVNRLGQDIKKPFSNFWMVLAFSIVIVETGTKKQFAPLNPKPATIPNPGIIAGFTLMLTN